MTALSQRDQALELANDVRTKNAALCNQIRGLSTTWAVEAVIGVLEQPAGHAGALPVDRLLRTIRWLGESRATRLLLRNGIYRHDRRIRDLTPRQRDALVGALRDGRWRT